MKKLLTGVFMAVLAGAMCASFAACGGDGVGGGGTSQNAEQFEGKEVTEEQWNAAKEALERDDAEKDYAEYTVGITANTKENVKMTDPESQKQLSASAQETTTVEFIKKGAKEYMKTTATMKYSGDYETIWKLNGNSEEEIPKSVTTETKEIYAEMDVDDVGHYTGLYTIYEKDDNDVWTKESDTPSPTEKIFYVAEDHVIGDYEDYVYDAKQKGYVPKDPGEDFSGPTVIKFDGQGRLIASIFSGNYNKEDGSTAMTAEGAVAYYITYTAKEIALPDAAEKEKDEMGGYSPDPTVA